jgi:DNA repair exonuclease SbcCD ATPase subunit
MSIGNTTQAVNLDNCQLTLVLGNNIDQGGEGSRNGVGKTTIINALSYAMYGDALTNIRKDNLINKSNGKNMLTTVDFEIGGIDYKIERGRRPNVLKLFVDGVEPEDEQQQGDSRETQKEIEKIIGFPHNMFKHLIALNTDSEPFLSMKTKDQREMIEQLLGITDLSAKAEILSALLKDSKDSIRDEEFKMGTIKESNARIEKSILETESKSKAWKRSHDAAIMELGTAIIKLEEIDIEPELENIKENSQRKKVASQRNTILDQAKQLNTIATKSAKRIEDLERQVEHASEGMCHACGQETAHLDTHEDYTKEVGQKLLDEQTDLKLARDQILALATSLEDFPEPEPLVETFYSSLEEALAHKHNLESLTAQLESKVADNDPYAEQITQLRETAIQELDFEEINRLSDQRDHQDFLLKLLTSKDSFIRKKIIDQNIAYLNSRMSNYLTKIGLPHDVKFNNELSVEITEYGRELDFDNLSKGERVRVILSLSWAFRDIYESLNRPMNLLCIDELIDSGLDTTGVEAALSILKDMNRNHGKNIMLVSHREELVGRVNNVLMVTKEGGFTSYANAEDDV